MSIYLTLPNFRQSYSNRLRRGVKSELQKNPIALAKILTDFAGG